MRQSESDLLRALAQDQLDPNNHVFHRGNIRDCYQQLQDEDEIEKQQARMDKALGMNQTGEQYEDKISLSTPTITPDDPWRHRSKGMRCETCMFYVKKAPVDQPREHTLLRHDDATELGRCRRHAPTMRGYPAVFVTDWCGDHKLDENKL